MTSLIDFHFTAEFPGIKISLCANQGPQFYNNKFQINSFRWDSIKVRERKNTSSLYYFNETWN